MKRFIFLLPTAAILLSGCAQTGSAVKAPDLDKSFSAEAELTYGKSSCTVQMKRIDTGRWEFCVTAPFALEGLVVSLKNGDTKLSMYDMESAADISGEAVSVARLISDAYEAAVGCGSAVSGEDGSLRLTGQAESSVYTLSTDKDGKPLSLSLDSGSVTAEFTKFADLERPDAELD